MHVCSGRYRFSLSEFNGELFGKHGRVSDDHSTQYTYPMSGNRFSRGADSPKSWTAFTSRTTCASSLSARPPCHEPCLGVIRSHFERASHFSARGWRRGRGKQHRNLDKRVSNYPSLSVTPSFPVLNDDCSEIEAIIEKLPRLTEADLKRCGHHGVTYCLTVTTGASHLTDFVFRVGKIHHALSASTAFSLPSQNKRWPM